MKGFAHGTICTGCGFVTQPKLAQPRTHQFWPTVCKEWYKTHNKNIMGTFAAPMTVGMAANTTPDNAKALRIDVEHPGDCKQQSESSRTNPTRMFMHAKQHA